MSSTAVAVDLFAVLLAVIGFHMAFRQSLVRRLLGARPTQGGSDEDPWHYALLIFGMMILAFGVILFAFITFYAWLTA